MSGEKEGQDAKAMANHSEKDQKGFEMLNNQAAAFILGAKKLAKKGMRSMAKSFADGLRGRAKMGAWFAAGVLAIAAAGAGAQLGIGAMAQSRLLATDKAPLSLFPMVFSGPLDLTVDDVSRAARLGGAGGQFALFCMMGEPSASKPCQSLAISFISDKNSDSEFRHDRPEFIADLGFHSNAEWAALLKDRSLTRTWVRGAKIARKETPASVERALDETLLSARCSLSPQTAYEWAKAAMAGLLNIGVWLIFAAAAGCMAFLSSFILLVIGKTAQKKTKNLVALAIEEGQGEAWSRREQRIFGAEIHIPRQKNTTKSTAKRL